MVERVTPEVSETGIQWDVKVRHVDDKSNKVEHIKASAVMVCNGWVSLRLWDEKMDLLHISKSADGLHIYMDK